jgi:hypothetical protein
MKPSGKWISKIQSRTGNKGTPRVAIQVEELMVVSQNIKQDISLAILLTYDIDSVIEFG